MWDTVVVVSRIVVPSTKGLNKEDPKMPGSSLKLWSLFWSAILRVLLNTFDRLSCVSGFNVHICFRTEPSRYGCHSWVEIWVRRVKLWTAGRTFGQFVILHAFTSCMSYCFEHQVPLCRISSICSPRKLWPPAAVEPESSSVPGQLLRTQELPEQIDNTRLIWHGVTS